MLNPVMWKVIKDSSKHRLKETISSSWLNLNF